MGLNEFVSTFTVNSLNHIFAADFGGNIYKSTDNGFSWSQKNVAPYVQSLIVNSQDYIFAGTVLGGIYYSTDSGENWIPINSGLNNLDVRALIVNAQDELIAGTEKGGVYRSVNPSSIEDNHINPYNFILYQNYPNPFNPSTTISWQSPVSSWQTIKMFNSLGQEVETIVDGYYEAGVHSKLYFVNSSLPSGVYFYQLKAGDYLEIKKMIYLK
jgi:hypothetical protein